LRNEYVEMRVHFIDSDVACNVATIVFYVMREEGSKGELP